MIIDYMRVHRLRLPLNQPWRTAYGDEQHLETVVVKAEADGATAWVETCPLATPGYLPDTAGGVAYMIGNFFAPLAVGRRLESANEMRALLAPYRGNSFAKAGVELCWWALESQRRGVPLRRLFNGRDEPVPVGEGIGRRDSIDDLLACIQTAVDQGFPRVKLKICRGWDLEVVQAARQAFPKLRLQVDANAGYTLADLPLFQALDGLGLDLIEQPLHWRDLADHAALQARLETPVCLDESVCSLDDAERALRLGACRVIDVKTARVGGLGEALAIIDRCRNAGVGAWIGSMLETGLGTACNIELATACTGDFPHAIPPSGRFHRDETVRPGVQLDPPGAVQPATAPYLGREVLEAEIERLSLGQHDVALA